MKMANIDAVFNFMFTDPKFENGVNIFYQNGLNNLGFIFYYFFNA